MVKLRMVAAGVNVAAPPGGENFNSVKVREIGMQP
jgi:hypothetical protein